MESVCNRVLIISKGKLVMDTSPDKLTALSPAHNSIRFTYSSDTALDLFDGLQHISSVDDVLIDRNALTADIMTKNGMNISGEVIRYFNEHHFVPKTFTVNKGKIDEVFSSLTLDKPVAENTEASASA
ncbi:hypothetical protein CHS0354_035293 [Potamilus streckersoni]|uniref:Uncharacterized protein n=1 Tax=Potamilus streckersoni TaxID=2493646 RepID=A0AAE0S2I5_9BIVA|nr:hypothetical protein CHS0354_035293 [Potamilus streckersoni]